MKLRKRPYGLRKSRNVRNGTIDNVLREMGFTPTLSRPCVYTNGSSRDNIMPTLFVYDLLIAGSQEAEVRRILEARFSTTNLGDVQQILGIEIARDKQVRTIELKSGEVHPLAMLEKFDMHNSTPVHKRQELERSLNHNRKEPRPWTSTVRRKVRPSSAASSPSLSIHSTKPTSVPSC